MAYGEHKAVLLGKLVTTAPTQEKDSCSGCAFHDRSLMAACNPSMQRAVGFSLCTVGEGHMYVETTEDQPAGATQVGGDHYAKRAIQPWDYIAANGLGFFEGNAVKYLTRWRDKGGIEDLKKARHYLDKLIEMEGGGNAS